MHNERQQDSRVGGEAPEATSGGSAFVSIVEQAASGAP